MHNSAVLPVSYPDRKGVVVAIDDFIFRHNGNILLNDEHADEESNLSSRAQNSILKASRSIFSVLDDGPIIEEMSSPASSTATRLTILIQKSRDIEKIVLSRASSWKSEL